MFCQECGKQIGDEALFCTHCGSTTAQGKTAAQPLRASASPVAASPARTPQRPPRFEKPEYGIPHCKFEETPEGFRVSFKSFHRRTMMLLSVLGGFLILAFWPLLAVFGWALNSGGPGFAVFIVLLIIVAGCVLFWFLFMRGRITRIEVNKEAVIINGKMLDRRHFAHFAVNETSQWQVSTQSSSTARMATLGYTYGNRAFKMGGLIGEQAASEIASALNAHLRAAPLAGDEHQINPEQLRSARPTDF